ncbi:class I SAM-dependent methyltransferase [Nonomuraea gerenzanensis]|uniref:SAM-dependent methyltransferase n=1 Tax=Nonomuraea gerenzanensis TaxID=93944 RepID=A0A1M4E7I3_9ACTN|nr:class I SAM-dependent methyltransferase [Nonomuraea gerenzanensis]UBU17011.1 methyltransferase domain-containing protein [Nonomuraea gerenzanensis]SBO94742.1 SAM-dependent methyltransferase [Nonomuraea gerenzanensis]
MILDPALMGYYERGGELTRLRQGRGRLEYWRTRDVLRRTLPPAPARVLDVGGGTGVHAEWLAAEGYDVELIDPVPLHVEEAGKLPGVRAGLGDARALPVPDGQADVVLLLGPLYHLPERADRVRALTEARRAARPGGLVVAACISRYACLHDSVYLGTFAAQPSRIADYRSLETGVIISSKEGGFRGYGHHPDEILTEFADAGLPEPRRYGLEGAFWLYGDVDAWLDDDERRELLLDAARRMECEPSLLGVSGHLLAVSSA